MKCSNIKGLINRGVITHLCSNFAIARLHVLMSVENRIDDSVEILDDVYVMSFVCKSSLRQSKVPTMKR